MLDAGFSEAQARAVWGTTAAVTDSAVGRLESKIDSLLAIQLREAAAPQQHEAVADLRNAVATLAELQREATAEQRKAVADLRADLRALGSNVDSVASDVRWDLRSDLRTLGSNVDTLAFKVDTVGLKVDSVGFKVGHRGHVASDVNGISFNLWVIGMLGALLVVLLRIAAAAAERVA